jgi:hypothetical protein
MSRFTAPPHSGQAVSGASLIPWDFSNSFPHEIQR